MSYHIVRCMNVAILRENEFMRNKSTETFNEHDLNNRKLLYNKSVGRKAAVSQVCLRLPVN